MRIWSIATAREAPSRLPIARGRLSTQANNRGRPEPIAYQPTDKPDASEQTAVVAASVWSSVPRIIDADAATSGSIRTVITSRTTTLSTHKLGRRDCSDSATSAGPVTDQPYDVTSEARAPRDCPMAMAAHWSSEAYRLTIGSAKRGVSNERTGRPAKPRKRRSDGTSWSPAVTRATIALAHPPNCQHSGSSWTRNFDAAHRSEPSPVQCSASHSWWAASAGLPEFRCQRANRLWVSSRPWGSGRDRARALPRHGFPARRLRSCGRAGAQP